VPRISGSAQRLARGLGGVCGGGAGELSARRANSPGSVRLAAVDLNELLDLNRATALRRIGAAGIVVGLLLGFGTDFILGALGG
jgi:hypothetical protein